MFQLPNLPDTSYIDQAEPDAGDFAALAERNTGVISGCLVTAQGTPALAVDIAGGTVLVGGVPVSVASGSLAVIAGEANPRFDLVVVTNTGAKSIIKGTSSTNPRFTTFDPSVYCLLAALYVRQSVSAIAATDVIDKRVTVPSTWARVYADNTTTAIQLTDSESAQTKTFKVMSGGEHRWMSSILTRIGDSAMSWATSLLVKAADLTLPVLALQARSGTSVQIAAQHLLELQNSSGTVIGYVNGAGQIYADNFKSGTGSPQGVVVGLKGDLYTDRSFTDANAALWIKTVDGGNTGWQAMGKYDPTSQAMTTGAVYAWIGNSASPPAGSVVMNGQLLSSTGPANAALLALIANSYGGTPGVNFAVPDWRDVSPMGVGTVVGTLGAKTGALTITQTIAQMPVHQHDTTEAAHTHPFPGFEYLWSSTTTFIRPWPSNLPYLGQTIPSIPYMNIAPNFFDRTAKTNISINNKGGGAPMSILSPVVGCHWLVRL